MEMEYAYILNSERNHDPEAKTADVCLLKIPARRADEYIENRKMQREAKKEWGKCWTEGPVNPRAADQLIDLIEQLDNELRQWVYRTPVIYRFQYTDRKEFEETYNLFILLPLKGKVLRELPEDAVFLRNGLR